MRVLLFAQLKDLTGRGEIVLRLAAPASAEDLWRELVALHPQLAPVRRSVRLARNLEYVGPDAQFNDTDEVALIPPVSGG